MTSGRTLLHDTHLEKVAILRINRKLMEYFKERYPKLIQRKAIKKTLKIVEKQESTKAERKSNQAKLVQYFNKN